MGKTAFEGKRGTLFLLDPQDLAIVTNKKDPRYDPRVELPLNEGLVANIMYRSQGVLEPVIVTKDGDAAVVVDGRQRVLAAREANRRLAEQGMPPLRVPCVLRRGDDSDIFGIMVSANHHRAEEPVIEKAGKVQRYLNMGHTEHEAAVLWGVSKVTIKNWVALLSLGDDVKVAVEEGRIAPSSAAPLARLPRDKQSDALKRMSAAAKRPSPRDAADAVKGIAPAKKRKMRSKREIEQVLSRLTKEHEAEDAVDARILGTSHYCADVLRWVLGEEASLWRPFPDGENDDSGDR